MLQDKGGTGAGWGNSSSSLREHRKNWTGSAVQQVCKYEDWETTPRDECRGKDPVWVFRTLTSVLTTLPPNLLNLSFSSPDTLSHN